MRRYQYTFSFVDTEDQAKALCNEILQNATDYVRRNKKPHYSAWTSHNGKEHKFVVWYWN